MGVLSGLEPTKVFEYFEKITQIPHGSGNVEAIGKYLVDFAAERGLEYIQDEVGNVIIIKAASPGYEQEPAVILQGHMDMVAVHRPELSIDMTREPLKLAIKGDRIYAEGTSLGGDDGIAVAYGLALLDDDTLQHPRLEVVITVDEEVGMDGARAIDLSMLQGRRLLNLDSEEEGIFLASCAGGARINCALDMEKELQPMTGVQYELTVDGLQGGHSGAEIHKERGNSNVLMARLLWTLSGSLKLGLCSCQGGLADNAIPRVTTAHILVEEADENYLRQMVEEYGATLRQELATKDPQVTVTAAVSGTVRAECLAGKALQRAASYLYSLPWGVQAMSADVSGLVETSLNPGILTIDGGKLTVEFSVRSCIESSKRALLDRVEALTALVGGTCEVTGDYPGWAYRVDSPLRSKMVALYERMYGSKPRVEAIHAGLECGILAAKLEDLDCISLGPDMYDIHTTEETLSISSTQRVWDYLVALLALKDEK
ncbi:MAG: aminoacyl-histidine dipeptidase [bacterium]|nr:aminoacyl-histidine dipeptidase [bacterium]MCM1376408.1 aminoacyl-histidine dipeptidase [Muribaculum sp.]